MAIRVKQGGTWKNAAPRVRHAGVWKTPVSMWRRAGGVWKKVWPDAVTFTGVPSRIDLVSGGTGMRTLGASFTAVGGGPYTYDYNWNTGGFGDPSSGSGSGSSSNGSISISWNVFWDAGTSQEQEIGSLDVSVTGAGGIQGIVSIPIFVV